MKETVTSRIGVNHFGYPNEMVYVKLPQRWWRKEGLVSSWVSLGERQELRWEYGMMAGIRAAAFDCLPECVALRYET